MEDDNIVLDVQGLEKTYGRRKVVSGVSLKVHAAEIVGLLGPNGAGKSTSFKMTCGIVSPDRGRVFLDGTDVTDWPLYRRASEGGMGYLAQESSVFRKLTVEQNILSIYELLGVPYKQRKERTQQLLEDFEITHIRRSRAAKLSGGERRRLEIARCLVSEPKIVMLDEPFAGIDPVTVQNIQEIIFKLRDRGIAILITDHAAREILQSVDRCYVISKGTVLTHGTPDQVRAHPQVRKDYLGDIVDDIGVARAGVELEGGIEEGDTLVHQHSATAAQNVPSPKGLFRGRRSATSSSASDAASKLAGRRTPQRSSAGQNTSPTRRRTDV
ncbi:MAG TPA: LPS export ABC transporter ATP-binding protein [Planctomycetaceae bacterium]|nr:LPS export ABC transporter ATP-binding protein [Planctomycetaceae bacterium]